MSATFSADDWSAGGWQRRGHQRPDRRFASDSHHPSDRHGDSHSESHGDRHSGQDRHDAHNHRGGHDQHAAHTNHSGHDRHEHGGPPDGGRRRGRGGPPPFLDWLAMAQGGDRPHGGRRRSRPAGGFPDMGEFADFGRAFADFGRNFGGGPHHRRGPRVGRGDVRAGILILLAEQPRNGYQIIQELEHRSDGVWRPSPGSIYPALSQLEDEGLIEQIESTGESKRLFRLTDKGTAYVESHEDELKPPWEALTGSVRGGMFELRDLLGQTAFAAVQVARAGTDAQVAAARTLLDETRRGLYRILADGDAPSADVDDDTEDDTADDGDQDATR